VDLKKGDVRLTMGGEPTFVSVDDPDGAGMEFHRRLPEKKNCLSGELIRRLRGKFAPGALLHYGQGKWYPGEPLPRWALAAYWRKDGVPVWKDDSLIADESRDYGFTARRKRAGLGRAPCENDWRGNPNMADSRVRGRILLFVEGAPLPSNVTPEKSNLKDKRSANGSREIFQQGLGAVAGYALPIKRRQSGEEPGWISGSWFLRDDDTLWLIPGDSPMGLRLPMDSFRGWPKAIIRACGRQIRRSQIAGAAEGIPSVSRPGQRFVGGVRCAVAGRVRPRAGARKNLAIRRGNGNRGRTKIRTASRHSKARRGSFAPPSASNRATAASMFSCRRSRSHGRLSGSWSPALKPPSKRRECRCSSKGKRRRAETRA
jgi:uncharacterized protein (DUF2126 family)